MNLSSNLVEWTDAELWNYRKKLAVNVWHFCVGKSTRKVASLGLKYLKCVCNDKSITYFKFCLITTCFDLHKKWDAINEYLHAEKLSNPLNILKCNVFVCK